jgi:hypothetical protein
MTDTTIRTWTGIAARISARVGHYRREVAARIYAAGDEQALRHGWTVTETTGRFGFEARSYRDPRFDDRFRQPSRGVAFRPIRSDAAPTSDTGE